LTFDKDQHILTNMNTVDNLLLEILNHPDSYAESKISKRDFNTLQSLASSVSRSMFITENQGNLLIKLLKENYKKLDIFTEKINLALSAPVWSNSFRHIEQIRKLTIEMDSEAEPYICIEYTFNANIRKALNAIGKLAEGLVANTNGKNYQAELTEKNIVLIVEALAPYNFDLDEKIRNFYEIIKSWNKSEFENQFLISNIDHKNFQKAITADLGIETAIDQNIINDRSMRYQYFSENPKNPGENLTEYIANRSKSRVWIDLAQHSLLDIFNSLKDLKRLPLLIVFESWNEEKSLNHLKILDNSLAESGLDTQVGIYFRLPNSDTGKQFNQLIKDRQYNHPLDLTTQVAVVQSGKIPKFFLKNPWQPMSVIALDTKMGLRHGKTSVYSNCCDLIIEWTEAPSILEQRMIL
jgi:hypothetical protein